MGPVSYVLIILFVVSAILGATGRISALRKIRAPRKYKDALLTWSHRPHPGYEHELIPWLTILIHMISLLLIGGAEFLMLWIFPLDLARLAEFPGGLLIAAFLLTFACLSAGNLWGAAWFYPIAEMRAGDSHNALSQDGWLFAGRLFPWNDYSHYSLDPKEFVIYLWSASLPGSLGTSLEFDSLQDMSAAREVVQSKLPAASQPLGTGPRKYAMPILMAVLCGPFVVLAFLMAFVPPGIGVVADAILMILLGGLGGQLLGFVNGKHKPALLE